MAKKRYPSDLTNKQWLLIKPHLPDDSPKGRPRKIDLRSVAH
jgi:transposase